MMETGRIPGFHLMAGLIDLNRRQRLLEILDQIVDVLDTDRQAHGVFGDAGGFQFGR